MTPLTSNRLLPFHRELDRAESRSATVPLAFRPNATVIQRLKTTETQRTTKSVLDLTLTILLAVPCAIVIAVAALLVRLTSRGPAIYSQTRLGQFGRPFVIYKLRTMYHNCERNEGPKWSNRGDSRVTWFGWILRKTHVDELPQLLNVWRGEMSLIGPRPERPEIVVALRREIAGYDRRLAVLPGVTGFAQVHLPPDETTECVRRKLIYDRYYVRYASWRLDCKILALTLLKVVGMRRLYARTKGR